MQQARSPSDLRTWPRQDVTLTAGFGIPSNAVSLLGRPMPIFEAWNYACAQSARCNTSSLGSPAALLQFYIDLHSWTCCSAQGSLSSQVRITGTLASQTVQRRI